MTDQNLNTEEEVFETPLSETTEETSDTSQPETTDEVAQLRELLAKANENLARSNADYQNLLRRTEKDRAEMAEFFTQNFAKKLLPTLDNLDRVVSGTPAESQTGAVYEGVKQAAAGLSKVLESMGVKAFESLGVDLDPNLHEALSQGAGPEGKIIMEFEKGYKLNDTVIRHAKVIVGNGTESPTA